MKKGLALLLSLLMLLSVSVVYGAQEDGLAEAITRVKSMVTVPEELSEFSYGSDEVYGQKSWHLTWRNSDNTERLSATIREDGTLTNFNISRDSDNREDGLSKISKEEGLAAAQAFLQNVTGDTYGSLQLESSSLAYAGFSYRFYQYVNDIRVSDNNLVVVVDKMTGEVTSYYGNYDDGQGYPAADGVVALDAAKAAYLAEIGVELTYESYYDYETETIHMFPAYTISSGNLAIDAADGTVVDLTEEAYRGLAPQAEEAAMDTNAGSGGGSSLKNELTPEEMAAVEEIAGLLTKEQAIEKVTSAVAGLDGYEASDARLYRNAWEKEKYVWNLSFRSEEQYGSASVDAKTGELLSFYCPANMAASEGENTLTQEEGKEKIAAFIRSISPDKFAKSEEAEQENRVYPRPIPLNEEEEVPSVLSVRYVRQENGIAVSDNYLRASIDLVTGEIYNYDSNWFDDVSFPSIAGVKTDSEILDAAADDLSYELMYRNFTENKLLVYDFLENSYAMYDPFTATRINGDGTAYVEQEAPVYTDIADHWCRDAALKLAENGIYFNRAEVKPDEAISQVDFLRFLYRTVSGYAPEDQEELYGVLENLGIINADEKAPDAAVTRKDAVRFVVRSLGYAEVAELSDIFVYPYGDAIEDAYKGYVAIATGLGIVSGDDAGNFSPDSNVTNGETVMIVYNMLAD